MFHLIQPIRLYFACIAVLLPSPTAPQLTSHLCTIAAWNEGLHYRIIHHLYKYLYRTAKQCINKGRWTAPGNLLQENSIVLPCLFLDKNTSFSQALDGRPIVAYRQPPNLKHLLAHNGLHSSDTDENETLLQTQMLVPSPHLFWQCNYWTLWCHT